MSALLGKRIVITRAIHQTAEFEALLRSHGAVPLLYPCIQIDPLSDVSKLREAIYDTVAGKYDWLILTSANTVQILCDQLAWMKVKLDVLHNLRIASVGVGTDAAVQSKLGLRSAFIPRNYTAEQLAETMQLETGQRILLPQSIIADDNLATLLSHRGGVVTVVPAYQNSIGQGGINFVQKLHQSEVDTITFTSASTVKNFMVRFEADGGTLDMLASVCTACIGSKTAAEAREIGMNVHVVPFEHTIAGLLGALETYYAAYKIGES